jgi:hypothetical protein
MGQAVVRAVRFVLRPIPAICCALVLSCAVLIFLAARILNEPRPVGFQAPDPPEASSSANSNASSSAVITGSVSLQPYEEPPGEDFPLRVKEIELTLAQTVSIYSPAGGETLAAAGKPEHREHQGEDFEYRHYILRNLPDALGFLQCFRENLNHLVDGARLHILNETSTRAEVLLDGMPVLDLRLEAAEPSAEDGASCPPQGDVQPRLAIIIDDIGESMRDARRLTALDCDLTFSVLPWATRARDVARAVAAEDKEVLLHLPMQPSGYPESDPGPGALFVDMGPEEIRRILKHDLSRVPEAAGANNHMGSEFTQHRPGMEIVIQELASRGLFFVDSITTPGTVARSVCLEKGCPYMDRNVFLDNVQEVEAILGQLGKAERIARKTGRAVAIGHPYPQTITALEHWALTRAKDVAVCRVSDLLTGPGQRTYAGIKSKQFKENVHD